MSPIERYNKYLYCRSNNLKQEQASLKQEMLLQAKLGQLDKEVKSTDNRFYTTTTVREPYLRRDTPANLPATLLSPISEVPMSSRVRGSSSRLNIEVEIKGY